VKIRDALLAVCVFGGLVVLVESSFRFLNARNPAIASAVRRGIADDRVMRELGGTTIPWDKRRVFLFGGSSIENARDYGALQAALADLNAVVVNMGVSSSTSAGIRRNVERVFPYGPDLVVIYAGHNDYWANVESLAPRSLWQASVEASATNALFRYSHTFRFLVHRAVHRQFANKGRKDGLFSLIPAIEVDQDAVLIDTCVSCAETDRALVSSVTPAVLAAVASLERAALRQFEENITAVLRAAKARRVPVLLVTPVAHPYRYEHYLSYIDAGKDMGQFVAAFNAVVSQMRRGEDATAMLSGLRHTYPENGLVSALCARNARRSGARQLARECEREAVESNLRSHKAKRAMNALIRGLERPEQAVHVLDFEAEFFASADDDMDRYFEDYAHPSQLLYEWLARSIAAEVRRVPPFA
jgi:lysophospholipase L1-like esterase